MFKLKKLKLLHKKHKFTSESKLKVDGDALSDEQTLSELSHKY
jgi:hypothetical protein